ncbi:MAG TPA: hypothetical protein VHG32_06325 [Thermoanaerobaculia bacterium]|jgi:hypothetical protein|nr:hypothetical protein [Thermoanaerobaculia bacterium]
MSGTNEAAQKVARELAKEAGITPAQALKVLEIFHFECVERVVNAAQKATKNTDVMSALGFSKAAAQATQKDLAAESLSLRNLTFATKKPLGVLGHGVIA